LSLGRLPPASSIFRKAWQIGTSEAQHLRVADHYGFRMDSDDAAVLLAIGGTGSSLTVTARRQAASRLDPWFGTEIAVEAFPFAGTLRTVFVLDDFALWARGLAALKAGTGRVVLGGSRAAELTIEAESQIGGASQALALSIDLTPSGDDPYPRLNYVIYDVSPTWSDIGRRLAGLG
jgi:hypothetical protein